MLCVCARCKGSKEEVVLTGIGALGNVSIYGMRFHDTCFLCSKCDVDLHTVPCNVDDNVVYCAQCMPSKKKKKAQGGGGLSVCVGRKTGRFPSSSISS